jgi:hypothetical protein
MFKIRVPDPNTDPADPHVYGPPRSGFISQRCGDRDPDPFIILLSSSKKSKKNLDSYCFVTSLDFLSMKNDVNVPYLQKVKSRKTFF